MGVMIGLTERERATQADAIERIARTMLELARSMRDPERDSETLARLIVVSLGVGPRVQETCELVLKSMTSVTVPDAPPE